MTLPSIRRLFGIALLPGALLAQRRAPTVPRKAPAAATPKGPPLAATDIAAIAELLKLEDRRIFDAAALQRLAGATHPELRRRTALAVARIFDPRGRTLLRAMRTERDTAVLATIVWATGQLVDTAAVPWLDSLLQNPRTPVGVAVEAAGAFGKIRTSDTRLRLSLYLANAAPGATTAPVVGEALLSIGRHRDRGEIASIVRWAQSADVDLRWRAAWALFRPRDPAAIPDLVALAGDPSPDVRYWAVRGITGPRADSSDVGAATAVRTVLAALGDPDRRVRKEAVSALGTYRDVSSMIQLTRLLDAEDPWIAVSAAEALGARGDNARAAINPLTAATSAESPPWVRAAALQALAEIFLSAALEPATAMAADTSLTSRLAAASVLARLGVGALGPLQRLRQDANRDVRVIANTGLLTIADTTEDPAARRSARRAAFGSPDGAVRQAAAASIAAWADAADIPVLLDAYALALRDTVPSSVEATMSVLADIEQRTGGAAKAFFARFTTAPSDVVYAIVGRAFGPATRDAWGDGRPVRSTRSDADYQRIATALVVPAYDRVPPPMLRWETTRGAVDTQLNPLDAPLATDYLLSLQGQGKLKDIRFERVVPNFVAQQQAVLPDEPLQRDEQNRGRLARGNLSWGTNVGNARHFPGRRGPGAGFDTGPAVYTFGVTPQPHNEGDFTALGRIIRGMDVVDRMELGDVVKSVRVLKPGER